jgi:hypothetical protein
MPQKQAQNTFEEGIVQDFSNYQTPPNVLTYAENAEFITHQGNENVIQTNRGNTYLSQLKPNYTCIGVKDVDGIAYIISAEYNADRQSFTGRGEIGTFPSPDYEGLLQDPNRPNEYECAIIDQYSPLRNYCNLTNPNYSQLLDYINYGEFNAAEFTFNINQPCEVELQKSYDNSMNIVFTDNYNPIRIVNSAFSVLPNKKAKIIFRTQIKDTNFYSSLNFNNTIKLVLQSTLITKLTFNGLLESTLGSFPTGNYKFYFRFATVDGNNTNIVSESSMVSMFHGNSVVSTRGGKGLDDTKDNVNKVIKFRLDNIDTSYSYVQVSYVYSYGKVVSAQFGYTIIKKYPITDTFYEFTFTGQEDKVNEDLNNFPVDFLDVDTARSICQIRNRLFIGNIKISQYNYELLKLHANKITTTYEIKKIPAFGVTQSNGGYDIEYLDAISGSVDRFGYNNSNNIYYNLGYWGGETYSFGIVYIYSNGSTSPVIPIRGIDNFDTIATPSYSYKSFNIDLFDTTNLENVQGVYRFPKRDLFAGVLEASQFNVLGVKFNFPIGEPQPEGTIGFYMVRTNRKEDVLTQGYMIDTLLVPTLHKSPYDTGGPGGDLYGSQLQNYNNAGVGNAHWKFDAFEFDTSDVKRPNSTNFSMANSKFIPAFGYMLESLGLFEADVDDEETDDDGNSNEVGKNPYLNGGGDSKWGVTNGLLGPTKYHGRWTPFEEQYKRFAFYSNDLSVNKTIYSQKLAGVSFYLHTLGQANLKMYYPNKTRYSKNNSTSSTFSLLKTVSHTFVGPTFKRNLKASLDYVFQDSAGVSPNVFSSQAEFTAVVKINDFAEDNDRQYTYHPLTFEDYIGVKLSERYPITNRYSNDISNIGVPSDVSTLYDGKEGMLAGFTPSEYNPSNTLVSNRIINIYKTDFLNKTVRQDIFKNKYQPANEQYFAITDRYYFPSTKPSTGNFNVLTNDTITAFQGDCFINVGYKKIYRNNAKNVSRTEINSDESAKTTRLGYTISIVTENNYNYSSREPELVEVEELRKRSFFPYNMSFTTGEGDPFGGSNPFSEYNLLETKQANIGFEYSSMGRFTIALDTSLPYITNRFETRVVFSNLNVKNSFINSYRYLQHSSKQDYDSQYGEIVAIKEFQGDKLFIIQERELSYIPIDERQLLNNDTAASIYISEGQVLNSRNAYVGNGYGTRWQFSIVSTGESIYGVDINNHKIWRFNGQLQLISDFRLQTLLVKVQNELVNKNITLLNNEVYGFYDGNKNNVHFTFINNNYDLITIYAGDYCCEQISGIGGSILTLETNYIRGIVSNIQSTSVDIDINSPGWGYDTTDPNDGGKSVTTNFSTIAFTFSYTTTYIVNMFAYPAQMAGLFYGGNSICVGHINSRNLWGGFEIYVNGVATMSALPAYVIPDGVESLHIWTVDSLGNITLTINGLNIPLPPYPILPPSSTNTYKGWLSDRNSGFGLYTNVSFYYDAPAPPPITSCVPVTVDKISGYKIAEIKSPKEEGSFKHHIAWNEQQGGNGRWTTYYTWYPSRAFSITGDLHSFPLTSNTEQIWQHHTAVTASGIPLYCNYYGEQKEFVIEFVVVDGLQHKVFTNLTIIANEVPPTKIEYTNDNEFKRDDVLPYPNKIYLEQPILSRYRDRYAYDKGSLDPTIVGIIHANHEYRENIHYIQIDKNTNDKLGSINPAKSVFGNNRQIRDKYCRIKITYEGMEYSMIQAIVTKYLESFS